ncbi:DDE-type integrase/transposase/recombinase [Pseudomonas mosselii]|nr:DDE-type integrase/transposase/recombinase [Pseudomonas mosselii]
MHKISCNSILSPVEGSKLIDGPVRVLGHTGDQCVVIDMTANPNKPWLIDAASLCSEIDSALVAVNVESPADFMIRTDAEISEREKLSRDKNWSLIRALVENKNPLDVLTSTFGADVKRHAELLGIDRKVVYRLLYRYWSLGQVKNAFLWNTSKCGGRGKSKSRESGIVPGRKPKYLGVVTEDRAIMLDQVHVSRINLCYGRFVSRKCGTLNDCYLWMLNKFYCSVNSDGTKGDLVRGAHPNLDQFKYQGKKFYDDLYVLKGRRGNKNWNKDLRPLVGIASQGVTGPCHRYEIDSTVADVYLVHRINRNWLIGRPVVYVVVDNYSRMIVGLHVGLEGPSWNGARHALYNAYTPKVDFCARYGVTIESSEWPCFHLPVELTADRAELLSNAGETMSNTLGTILNIPPPYRPDWKAIVESRFRLLNNKVDIRFVPGGVDARRQERGDRDYQLDAILDLDEFTQMMISAVLHHNKHLRVPHILTKEMVREGIEPTPLNIWNWGMNHNMVHSKVVTPSELKIALLPSQECRITRAGIQFKGVIYTCELAERENWAARSHNFSTKYVRVWYDPNSIENCWIKVGAEFLSLTIVPYLSKKFAGYRLEEVVDFLSITGQQSPDSKHDELIDSVRLKGLHNEIIDGAKAKKKVAGRPTSKADHKSNKQKKRSTEVAVERNAETAELGRLHLVKSPSARSIESTNAVTEHLSTRSAAFLKLVVSESQEPNP